MRPTPPPLHGSLEAPRSRYSNSPFETDTLSSSSLTSPPSQCQSAKIYEAWVKAAGGVIKGVGTQKEGSARDADAADANGAHGASAGGGGAGGGETTTVVPLWLLKQSNDEQMGRLFTLLRREPLAIHWYV